jgi:hypothetical protein
MIEFAMRSSWGMIELGWLTLAPAAVFLAVFIVLVMLAPEDPDEPKPPEVPRWRGGWRV